MLRTSLRSCFEETAVLVWPDPPAEDAALPAPLLAASPSFASVALRSLADAPCFLPDLRRALAGELPHAALVALAETDLLELAAARLAAGRFRLAFRPRLLPAVLVQVRESLLDDVAPAGAGAAPAASTPPPQRTVEQRLAGLEPAALHKAAATGEGLVPVGAEEPPPPPAPALEQILAASATPQAAALLEAAQTGAPFCEACERKRQEQRAQAARAASASSPAPASSARRIASPEARLAVEPAPQAAALRQAASTGAPFCEACERAAQRRGDSPAA